MRLLSIARHPPRYVRIALAMLLLAFAADTIAHVTHTHEARIGAHATACGYCAAFHNIVDAPAQTAFCPATGFTNAKPQQPLPGVASVRSACSAQPRAPPLLLIRS